MTARTDADSIRWLAGDDSGKFSEGDKALLRRAADHIEAVERGMFMWQRAAMDLNSAFARLYQSADDVRTGGLDEGQRLAIAAGNADYADCKVCSHCQGRGYVETGAPDGAP